MFVHQLERNKVAEAKILMWLFYGIGIPLYGFALYVNIATWKSDVLFVSGMILVAVRTYYHIKRSDAILRKEKQEAELREIEIEIKRQRLY